MEDMNEEVSPTGFQPLFIQEQAGEQDRTHVVPREHTASALIKPYLQEMDDLLKSCEEFAGIPFGFSEGYTDTSLSQSTHMQSKEEVSRRETGVVAPNVYRPTSYIDTHMDGAATEEELVQERPQDPSAVVGKQGVPLPAGMPVTSAGKNLSNAMVQYEGQLLGMLAMLESCMEESGMDFEPQDWAADAGEEYVHISKKPHLHRGTMLVPAQQGAPGELGTRPLQSDPTDQGAEGGTAGSTTVRGSQERPSLGGGSARAESAERVERPGMSDRVVFDPQLSFSEGLNCKDDDLTYCEGARTQSTVDEAAATKEEEQECVTDRRDVRELGSRMEECIQEVQCLVEKRRQLLAEVLQLRGNGDGEQQRQRGGEETEMTEEQADGKVAELMERLRCEEEGRREERREERRHLREERAEEERRIWKVNLERQGLQEELRALKRRLFAMVRECTHSQASLDNQRREVELLRKEEEKLQALMLQLTEESGQLRTAHQQLLTGLQAQLQAQTSSQSTSTQEELAQCRRHSCGDLQQYLQGALQALDSRYEPIMLALLRRREATAGALVKAKEQALDLRAQLGPLRDEIQRLKLQRACLEEKLKLVYIHRREDAGRYKETVNCLEESSRELKTELNIQKRKTKEMEELKDSLVQQLRLYRIANEDHNMHNNDEET